MSELTALDSVYISAVLADTVDQLAVLGKIMPQTFEGRPDANEMVGDEISQILDSQRNLESTYENLIHQRGELRGGPKRDMGRLQENSQQISSVVGGLRNANQTFTKSLKQSPLTADNLYKMQDDRQFLQDVLSDTLEEMLKEKTFMAIIQAVSMEKEKKAELQNTILKEEEGRKEIKSLQKQIATVRIEREEETQQRNQMIAHLKDQLQEMKAKTSMEGKYVQKDAEVAMGQTQKRCSLTEKEMKNEIELLKQKIDEEQRVNTEIETYLKRHQTEMEEKVEYWMEKYDKDVEAKTHELEVLKASKANDLSRLQELTNPPATCDEPSVDQPSAGQSAASNNQGDNDLKDAIKRQVSEALCSRAVIDKVANAIFDLVEKRLEEEVTSKVYEAISMDLESKCSEIKQLNEKVKLLQNSVKDLQTAKDEAEQYSRRNCLRIHGIVETPNESTDDKVLEVINRHLGIDLGPAAIDRSHRVNRRHSSSHSNDAAGPEHSATYADATRRSNPRAIIVKFTRYNDRQQVYKARTKLRHVQGAKIFIRESLTNIRSSLYWETLQNNKVKSVWSQDGKIFAFTKENKRITIGCKNDLDLI
ncbi:dynein regulatory complex protein 9-like [Diadema setosum]|uniref:dynein regulatory complex protein 9-like n=1 Tax=Diadema setosum TaxID=31175 RepID=UPI003B3B1ED5